MWKVSILILKNIKNVTVWESLLHGEITETVSTSYFLGEKKITCAECAGMTFEKIKDYEKCVDNQNLVWRILQDLKQTDGNWKNLTK